MATREDELLERLNALLAGLRDPVSKSRGTTDRAKAPTQGMAGSIKLPAAATDVPDPTRFFIPSPEPPQLTPRFNVSSIGPSTLSPEEFERQAADFDETEIARTNFERLPPVGKSALRFGSGAASTPFAGAPLRAMGVPEMAELKEIDPIVSPMRGAGLGTFVMGEILATKGLAGFGAARTTGRTSQLLRNVASSRGGTLGQRTFRGAGEGAPTDIGFGLRDPDSSVAANLGIGSGLGATVEALMPGPAGAAGRAVTEGLERGARSFDELGRTGAVINPTAPRAQGRTQAVVFPGDGTTADSRYIVREADDLLASHTPDYQVRPADEIGPEHQNRAYGKQEQEFTETIVRSPNPDRLLDASVSAGEGPTVFARGGQKAVAGHGRLIAQQRIWKTDPKLAERVIRQPLLERAAEFGLDPAVIREMREPIIGRELLEDFGPDEIRRLNLMSDISSAKAKDPLMEGASRARQLRSADGALTYFADTVGDETISSYMNTRAGFGFFRKLIDDGVIAAAERARFITPDGKTTSDGRKLIEGMLYSTVIPDPEVLARAPARELNKLDTAIPAIVRAGKVEGWGLEDLISDAFDALAKARAEGLTIADLGAQTDLLAGGGTVPADVLAMARFLQEAPKNTTGAGRLGIKDAFRAYANDAEAAARAAQSTDLFGHTPKTAEQSALERFGVEGFKASAPRVDPPSLGGADPAFEARMQAGQATPEETVEYVIAAETRRADGSIDLTELVRRAELDPRYQEAALRPQPGSGLDTFARYGFDYDDWSKGLPERRALVDGWLETLTENGGFAKAGKGALEIRTDKKAVVVMGPPAAGKSTAINDRVAGLGARLIDPDEAKELIPEYRGGIGGGEVHAESSWMADQLFDRAINRGENIIIPGTGKNLRDQVKLVDELRANGYEVELVLVDADLDTVARRAFRRLHSSGRYTAMSYITEAVGTRPRQNFERIYREADSATRYFSEDGPRGTYLVDGDGAAALGSDGAGLRGGRSGEQSLADQLPPEATGAERLAVQAREADTLAPLSDDFTDIDPEHVLLSKFALDPDGTRALAEAVRRVAPTDKAVESFTDMREIAESMGLTGNDILKGKDALGRHEMIAIRDLVNRNVRLVADVSKGLSTGKFPDEDSAQKAYQLLAAVDGQTDALLGRFIAQRTEDGRNLAAHRILANQSLDPFVWMQRAKTRMGNDVPIPTEVKVAIEKHIADSDVDQLIALVRSLDRSPIAEQLSALWKAGLLTAPPTHIVNVVSTGGNVALERVKDYAAAGSDKILTGMLQGSAKMGAVLRGHAAPTVGRSKSAAGGFWRTIGRGTKRGLGDARRAMRGSSSSLEAQTRWDWKDTTIDFVPTWLGGGVANPLLDGYQKFVFRTLNAEDKVFKGIRFEQSVLDQAHVAAMRAGDKKMAGSIYDGWRSNGYRDLPDDVFLQAVADAEVATFTDQSYLRRGISGAKQALQRGVQKDPTGLSENLGVLVTESIAPFTGTPTNIVSRVIEYSGGGILKGGWDASRLISRAYTGREVSQVMQRSAMESMGRGLTGAGFLGLGYMFYKDGRMTLNYPSDPGERGNWDVTGKQEFSIWQDSEDGTPPRWHSMERFSPIGNLMAVGGYLARGIERSDQDPERGLGSALAEGGFGLGSMVLEQSFLEGMNRFIDAIQAGEEFEGQGERAISRYLKGQASSIVPNIVRRVAQSLDTGPDGMVQVRTSDNWKDAIKANTPWLRESLPLGRDEFGTVRTRKSAREEFIDVSYSRISKAELDGVRAEFARLGAPLSRKTRDRKGGETSAEFSERQRVEGRQLWEGLNTLVSSDWYRVEVFNQAGTMARNLGLGPAATRQLADNLRREMIAELVTRVRSGQSAVRRGPAGSARMERIFEGVAIGGAP